MIQIFVCFELTDLAYCKLHLLTQHRLLILLRLRFCSEAEVRGHGIRLGREVDGDFVLRQSKFRLFGVLVVGRFQVIRRRG